MPILVFAVLAQGALVLVLRVSGKRTLAKMNAFDLAITVRCHSRDQGVRGSPVPHASEPTSRGTGPGEGA